MGVMLQDIALLFPRGFILRVVLPLYFVELHQIISSHSFLSVQDLDGMLDISQIRLEGKSFNFHNFIQDPQTLLQLRYVEHIMYRR